MARCATIKMVGGTIPIGCNTGLISGFTHLGVYAFGSDADQNGLCSSGETGDSTGNDCASLSAHESSLFETLKECVGKQSCIVRDIHDHISVGTTGSCTIGERDTLYVQYTCQVPEAELETKRQQALQAGCAAIFSCLVLLAVTQYRAGSISVEKSEWDLLTVTASDYTLEVPLSYRQVQAMRKAIKDNSFMPYESEGLRLKLWLTKRIEEQLAGGKVASVDFTYHNSWLLDMLKERGDYIKWQDWRKLRLLNREMTFRIKDDIEQAKRNNALGVDDADFWPTLADPISAFVSMESEESYNLLAGKSGILLGDGESEVREALEPTNIYWENYDFDDATRSKRRVMILATTAFVLLVTFGVTFAASDARQ